MRPLALRPPSKDDKPVVQKNKAAFDRAPKPPPPKLVRTMPRLAFDAPRAAPQPLAGGKLQQWLLQHRAGSCCEDALRYLMQGPPYRGVASFDAKEAVKAAGARWVPNPEKVYKGMRDGVAAGWWSAHTERDLLSLLRMPANARGRRTWTGLALPEWAHASAASLLVEFAMYEGVKIAPRHEQDAAEDVERPHHALPAADGGSADMGTGSTLHAPAAFHFQWTGDTYCDACKQYVSCQFADCGCPSRSWEWCTRCQCMRVPEQPCMCATA